MDTNINRPSSALMGIVIGRGGLDGVRQLMMSVGKPKRNGGICASCSCQIPPGRPGRKCKPCREREARTEGRIMEVVEVDFDKQTVRITEQRS